MFNLNQAIADWRIRMERASALTETDVDELEGHLWELIDQLLETGLDERAAFVEATTRLGGAHVLAFEYEQEKWSDSSYQEPWWVPTMVKNYLLIAVRNLRKHKGYAFINITGLAVGLASCLLIFLYVYDEYSYDRFHADADQIYRIVGDFPQADGTWLDMTSVLAPVGASLRTDYPDVEAVTQFFSPGTYHHFKTDQERFAESGYLYADSYFWEVFDFQFLHGDPETAFNNPSSVVLTASTARKYFGTDDAMGQVLVRDMGSGEPYTVTGIIEDLPAQSHVQFPFILSVRENLRSQWQTWFLYTYVKLQPGANHEAFAQNIRTWATENADGPADQVPVLTAQALTDIHLRSNRTGELGINGDIRYLYIFSAIALLILVVASINFINLSTARSATRAREVGMRKVLGAHQGQLVRQFIGESVLTTLLALPLAILLVEATLPILNAAADKTLTSAYLGSGGFWMACLTLLFVLGLIGGSYPAFFLASFRPIQVLKGSIAKRGTGRMRNALVIVQFGISAALIMGTLVIRSQMAYIQDKNLGFNEEQLVVLTGTWALQTEERYAAFRQALLQQPGIVDVARISQVPWNEVRPMVDGSRAQRPVRPEGFTEALDVFRVNGTANMLDVLGTQLLAGRLLNTDSEADRLGAALINETLAQQLGWTEPLGKTFTVERSANNGMETVEHTLTVVGVTEDIHFASLRDAVQPALFTLPLHYWGAIRTFVRIDGTSMRRAMDAIDDTWTQFLPTRHLELTFADDEIAQLYQADQRLGTLTNAFAFLAILVACLGLFGLATFMVEQRTREIGVRKVLGATIPDVVLLLSKDFTKWVALGVILASPLAYIAMDTWLQDFAYRIALSWWMPLLAGGLALTIALATVSYQALRAAATNPVDALRYE